MVEPENKLVCRGDTGVDPMIDRRMKALLELGLLEAQTTPVFEEATQTAAHLLEVPICILGFLDRNRHAFKSAVGLSRLGLMNPLAQERQLPIHESFCTQVVETSQIVNVGDTRTHPAFANSVLVQRYGILAYLGVPLIDSSGLCLGAIAVMDLEPRNFSIQQMKFLELMARWSMSEFERNRLLKMQQLEPLEQRAIEIAPQILSRTSNLFLTSYCLTRSPFHCPSQTQVARAAHPRTQNSFNINFRNGKCRRTRNLRSSDDETERISRNYSK